MHTLSIGREISISARAITSVNKRLPFDCRIDFGMKLSEETRPGLVPAPGEVARSTGISSVAFSIGYDAG